MITYAVVGDVENCEQLEAVYNLHTEKEHNFIVNGIVAHNVAWFYRLRSAFHRLFVDRLAVPCDRAAEVDSGFSLEQSAR
jgi:hypothetical protein